MPPASDPPSYGVVDHYLGAKGEEYFSWQQGAGDFGGRINTHKFQHLIGPSSTVLDFGCGGGYLLRQLSCARRIGVEVNPVARQAAIANGIECHAQISDIPDGVADVIVTDHVLEHVPNPVEALRQLRHKLAPDGLIGIVVPHCSYRGVEGVFREDDANYHLHGWNCQTLGNTVKEAGYKVIEVRRRTHAWPGRWTVACYGRLPLSLFDQICFWYGTVTGNGKQVIAIARNDAQR